MRIKNISNRSIEVEGYNKHGNIEKQFVNPGKSIEVNTSYYLDSFPMNFKEVSEPIKRYNTQWILVLGGAILGYIGGFLTKQNLLVIKLLLDKLFS